MFILELLLVWQYSNFEILYYFATRILAKKNHLWEQIKFLAPLTGSILLHKGLQEACLNTNLSPREIQRTASPFIYHNKEVNGSGRIGNLLHFFVLVFRIIYFFFFFFLEV